MLPRDPSLKKMYVTLGCPMRLEWKVVKPYQKRAQKNHSQTLETLARRGGLDPGELHSLFNDLPLDFTGKETTYQQRVTAINRAIHQASLSN